VATADDAVVAVDGRSVDRANDLAFLHLSSAVDGPWLAVKDDLPRFDPGRIVIAVTGQVAPPLVGVVGAEERSIPLRNGVLGVRLDRWFRGDGARIDQVHQGGGAEAAGLKEADIIVRAGGVAVNNPRDLQKVIFAHLPGDAVPIVALRDGSEVPFQVTLAHMSVNDAHDPLTKRNAEISGRTSRRKSGFTRIIQHDIALTPEDMGSPLLDVSGNLVGINIARVDRVTTFALHASSLREAYQKFIARSQERPDGDGASRGTGGEAGAD
jgi:S1-C subfamily serine protease